MALLLPNSTLLFRPMALALAGDLDDLVFCITELRPATISWLFAMNALLEKLVAYCAFINMLALPLAADDIIMLF